MRYLLERIVSHLCNGPLRPDIHQVDAVSLSVTLLAKQNTSCTITLKTLELRLTTAK